MNFSLHYKCSGHVHVVAQGMQQRGSTIFRGHLLAGSWASATVSTLLTVFHYATTQTDPHRIRACYFSGQTKKTSRNSSFHTVQTKISPSLFKSYEHGFNIVFDFMFVPTRQIWSLLAVD